MLQPKVICVMVSLSDPHFLLLSIVTTNYNNSSLLVLGDSGRQGTRIPVVSAENSRRNDIAA
jgi:hypothetical protein